MVGCLDDIFTTKFSGWIFDDIFSLRLSGSPIFSVQVAEDLYQAGFISYPRTETDSFSERTNLHVGNCF